MSTIGPTQNEPIHHIKLVSAGCCGRLLLNGFRVISADNRWSAFAAPTVNHLLVGHGNVLEATISALVVPGVRTFPLSSAQFYGSVVSYRLGDIVGPEESGRVLGTFNLHTEISRGATMPIRIRIAFDNDGPAFPALFRGTVPFEDEKALVDYAIHLRNLVACKNVEDFLETTKIRWTDYAKARYESPAVGRAAFADYLSNVLFARASSLDFPRNDLSVTSHCGGRIWEVHRRGKPLFETTPDANGVFNTLRVYVARIGGSLHYVR